MSYGFEPDPGACSPWWATVSRVSSGPRTTQRIIRPSARAIPEVY